MRIALIAGPWVAVPPPAYGGIETVLDHLARGLDAAGHEVFLAATGDATCPVTRTWLFPEALGVQEGGSLAELRHVRHAYKWLGGLGCDVVHDHTLAGPALAAEAGFPVITTNHGPFDENLAPYYAAIADDVPIIAISESQAATAGSIPIAGVVHHGIDVDSVPVGAGDGGYAAFVGRMCPEKGIPAAIQIARAAGVPLRIAAKMSEPQERSYFEREVAPLLGGDVEYVGELDRDEGAAFVGAACCLLNPIQWEEPFGMVMVEALATGTPVLATARGAAPEIVVDGRTGFVRQREEDLATCLRRVGEVDRGECRTHVATWFSTERMVEGHLRMYAQVAGRGTLVA
jgi:glycosyltransferase involved in cell wall biosynthesis